MLKIKHLGFAILLAICVTVGWLISRPKVNSYVYRKVCNLVHEKVDYPAKELNDWHKDCLQESGSLPIFQTKKSFLFKVQQRLNKLDLSHLYILIPSESTMRKKGVFRSTGMQARWVEGRILISKVIEDSPAWIQGVRTGFEVVSVNNVSTRNTDAVLYSGKFKFKYIKDGKEHFVDRSIKAKKIKIKQFPSMHFLNASTVYLKINSFYNPFFSKNSMQEIDSKIGSKSHLVIDLRGNVGGSLVQSLRLLSYLNCGKTNVGRINRIREVNDVELVLDDDMNFGKQYANLRSAKSMSVDTFLGYGCYKGKVYVLIDEDTGSSAEILAQSIIELKRGKVLGKPSAGQVLMAFEYSLVEFGEGYSLMLPEATFISKFNKNLEGAGVQPDIFLSYDLSTERLGKDSWILKTLEQIKLN